MRLPRPRSLNGLILVGFGLVALPLLVAVVWALVNLDRLAKQSEDLVVTGVATAANNRQLAQNVASLERLVRQYLLLRTPDSLSLLKQDLEALEATLDAIAPLAAQANASELAADIRNEAVRIVGGLPEDNVSPVNTEQTIAEFAALRQDVARLSVTLDGYIEQELNGLQASIRRAQQISAWQTAALVPGTVLLVLFFTLLVARPIRQIDRAIRQLGQSGFSKSIQVTGPTDLERLGRQLDWLRIRLLELAQEKNRFLRHMSHELKTPLANIREGTELLLDGTVGELAKPQREVTDILRANGIKLQQLIENLLSFSAWQTKSEVLTLSEYPLRAQIIDVAKAQRLALKSGRIHLRLDIDDFVVRADQDKMRTVFDNLLSNAVKFTPPGGTITVRATRTPHSFMVEFADTGPGIPEDERSRVFDAFFQGRQKQGGHVAGTGIGLSVVQECVQAHDGTVEIVDSDEFPGAHFRITIPQQRVAQPVQKVAASA
ncbi:MAG TPA: HAMP domain-containing sensor histidine kinase [Woeseiaceae bacterium]|nr:HAMP domain-containing sensor histidine kinase [Woeseiaceae bacterium]